RLALREGWGRRRNQWLAVYRRAPARRAMARRNGLRRFVVGAGLGAVLVAGAAGAQAPLVRVSDGPSRFVAGCDGATPQGKETNYPNSEVEPRVAVNPNNPAHAVGVWQQDRWSNGAA